MIYNPNHSDQLALKYQPVRFFIFCSMPLLIPSPKDSKLFAEGIKIVVMIGQNG